MAQAQGDTAESAGPEDKSHEACAGRPPTEHTRVRHSTAPPPRRSSDALRGKERRRASIIRTFCLSGLRKNIKIVTVCPCFILSITRDAQRSPMRSPGWLRPPGGRGPVLPRVNGVDVFATFAPPWEGCSHSKTLPVVPGVHTSPRCLPHSLLASHPLRDPPAPGLSGPRAPYTQPLWTPGVPPRDASISNVFLLEVQPWARFLRCQLSSRDQGQ